MAIAIRSNSHISYPTLSAGAFTAARAIRETGPVGAPKPRLHDRIPEAIRARHYARRTEKAYVHCPQTTPTGCSRHDPRGRETHPAGRGGPGDIL